ncbi:ly6/PLAUR domain-containing protein 1 isoform X1 [Austrofundulus limnaeus]|uniref:Ly6/PLAUR domain-containing protein 1 isoform X1 n=1 Tax=Austrofundulus limnaeus TaxID=52670 RepID=A0A2I4CNX4_AUSLI|nr:PREDICTED: ly6/PLAUR domain-containing protein 1 isoform X1 [Austrofundulus limnaeus]
MPSGGSVVTWCLNTHTHSRARACRARAVGLAAAVVSGRSEGGRMRLLTVSALLLFLFSSGLALQIQCYQCEETTHDCSTPDFIVNCTVNVQDMCQKEVLVKDDGIHYRKSCASSGACLIASSGYQQFCTGKLNSVCITCCNTPLCNGPRQKRRPPLSSAVSPDTPRLPVVPLFLLLLDSVFC